MPAVSPAADRPPAQQSIALLVTLSAYLVHSYIYSNGHQCNGV